MQPHESLIVVLVRSRRDWHIVQTRHWYRLPVKNGPTDVSAQWVAFYLPKSFGEKERGVRWYARIRNVETVRRVDLFPHEPDHPRAQNHYFAISFDPPIRLTRPLLPDRGRRFIWSRTTLWRLTAAQTFDDLFRDEPLVPPESDQVLIGVVPRERDFEIARLQRWYRVPTNMVRDWQTPSWIAFYFGRGFGGDAGKIRYYARVWHADIVRRLEMFPDQPRHPRANAEYVRIHHSELQERPTPIRSHRQRQLVVLPTTWERFMIAADVNDLVVGDEVEEAFYGRLSTAGYRPERAYYVRGTNAYRLTDYAIFCSRRNIEIDIASQTLPKRLLVGVNDDTDSGVPDGWAALRLSRFDITKRRDESIDRVRELVDASGGVISES